MRRTWLTGDPVWMRDVAAEPTFKRAALAAQAGLRSAFAFPITAAGRVLGVVEFYSHDVEEPDAELLDCTRYVGSQIGQFCSRAQAQAQLRDSERLLRRHHRAGGHRHRPRRRRHALCAGQPRAVRAAWLQPRRVVGHDGQAGLAPGRQERGRQGARPSCALARSIRSSSRNATCARTAPVVWVQITISVQRDSAGRPGNDISIIQDITARKQAELAVQRSEQRFRSLVELSSDWYWELDAELRFTAFGGRDMGDKYEQPLRGRLAWEIPGPTAMSVGPTCARIAWSGASRFAISSTSTAPTTAAAAVRQRQR